MCRALIVGLLATERSLLPVRRSGTVCRPTLLCVTDIILPETENFFVFYIISMTTFFFLVVLEVFT